MPAIARVLPLVGLAHLDREFDYLVPTEFDEIAVPGVRVRVRFAGRLVDGFIIERTTTSEHAKLGTLQRVISGEVVLTSEVLRLVTDIADRYAGTRGDVLRLAIPPRHARTEAAQPADPDPVPGFDQRDGWEAYEYGGAFLDAVLEGRGPRAAWQAKPGEDWPARLAELAIATASTQRGALLIVPDQRDLDRLAAAFNARGVAVTALAAELGPSARYRRWLRVLRGQSRIVIGTRAAAYAPLTNLGLVAVWDDGDDNLAEQRAPYPHAREIALMRALHTECAVVIGGYARTSEVSALVASGWLKDLVVDRAMIRHIMPRINAAADNDTALARDPLARQSRIPAEAFTAVRQALGAGQPVLVQVPRKGYIPAIACAQCREPVRCRRCHGPLQLTESGEYRCQWCGQGGMVSCGRCGSTNVRALVIGSGRTAEELGRAFPGVPVVRSGGDSVVAAIKDAPQLVVATIGAEPIAASGYGAALLLDGWASLSRADLRVAEEALRRWMAAATLVRPGSDGGRVLVMADAAHPTVQALVRWDPIGHAARQLAERVEVGFPPAIRMASIEGDRSAVIELIEIAELPATAEVLGPVSTVAEAGAKDDADPVRALVRTDRREGLALARALHAAQGVRSARKRDQPVRIRIDPLRIS